MNIRQFAKLAGVSPATVSLALNNKKGIGRDTRERILELAKENNYIATNDNLPKNILFLKYIKHGMIVEENAGFIAAILDSIENDCKSQGYTLNMVSSINNLKTTLYSINYKNFFGIILLGTELDESSYPLLDEIPIPFVVIDNIMPHLKCNSIAIDNFEIVYGALEHLRELGHKDIAYFKSNISIQNFDERSLAFNKYVDKFRFVLKDECIFEVTPTLLGAYNDALCQIPENVKLPSCAFADNDTIAIGVIKALKKLGYKVPQDISIIGFDDIPFAAINTPTLSTMSVPKKAIGSLSLQLLHLMIENETHLGQKIRVSGTKVHRNSTREL
ncbi:MAG: LacI family DNA-binding transcriptional regulator [Lachnospirales bacterium]